MSQSHFEPATFKHLFFRIWDNFNFKLICGLLSTYIGWCFNNDYKILISLYLLVLIDAITGVTYAVKSKTVTSRGLYRTAVKCLVYFTMLLVAKIVDKYSPVNFASSLMETFLIMTEALSILENLGKLGFKVPTKLLSKLKDLNK